MKEIYRRIHESISAKERIQMRIFDIPRYSFQAIQDRKLRSGLTILMVAIGVTLITALNGLGGGFSFFIGDQFRSLNPDVLIITPTSSIPEQGGQPQKESLLCLGNPPKGSKYGM